MTLLTSKNPICFHIFRVYGSLRRVLDIFEGYLGQQIRWQFWDRFERLEVIPLIDWDNAQSGYGFMEFGVSRDETGTSSHYALTPLERARFAFGIPFAMLVQ